MSNASETQVVIAGAGPIGVTAAAVSAAHGHTDVHLIGAPDANVGATVLPLIRDTAGDFARTHAPAGASAYVVRPDGYLGLAASRVDPAEPVTHLRATFAADAGLAG
jgi:2-polyprenyl-6-methoxyphenol hydroxylase-like FAD-dependent oxidoreductase